MKISLGPARLLAGALLLTTALRAEVTLRSGFDYSTGDYGLPLSTEIITIPFTVSYVVNRTTWELNLPYVHIDGPGDIVPGIGRFSRRLGLVKSVNQGLGDLAFSVIHQFATPAQQPWSWSAGVEVKFGTADADKSLGTGEDDFTTRVDLQYAAGTFTPFLTLGYRTLGNPPGSDLRDHWFGTVGVSWACTEKTTLTVLADWSEKNSASGTAASSFMLSASRGFGAGWGAQLYGVRGGSQATADYGLGFSVSRDF